MDGPKNNNGNSNTAAPATKRRRRRLRWIVTIGSLPTTWEWRYAPGCKVHRVQVPCALPPADPTHWPRKRDAVRAMDRTVRFNRFVMGKTALCGDWLVQKVPGIALFAKPLAVGIRRVRLVRTDCGWLCEENLHA
jgi:hypothetical protein